MHSIAISAGRATVRHREARAATGRRARCLFRRHSRPSRSLDREMDALESVPPDHGRDIGARLQDRRHNGHKSREPDVVVPGAPVIGAGPHAPRARGVIARSLLPGTARVGKSRHWRPPESLSRVRLRSDRQRDLTNNACENEQSAQAMAFAFVREEQPSEADQRGKGYGDLASSVHVSFPQRFPTTSPIRRDCS